jgi:GNAT superfamily N-acetyltransferase
MVTALPALAELASAEYVGELGDGLVRRWSTAADEEKIGLCLATVFRHKPDDPLNQSMVNRAAIMFSSGFPLMGPGDFALVEDTSRPERPIIACTCYWSQRWSYGGIPFGLGRPEYVATLAEYRNRGLMRALFEMIHARSAARGDLVQAITGIPYYYRQFGYEYALDLGGGRKMYAAAIPTKKEGEAEAYRLRLATEDDATHMLALYNQRRATSLVWCETTEDHWRYYVSAWDLPVVRQEELSDCGLERHEYMIVDADDHVCGFVSLPPSRNGRTLHIGGLLLYPHVNWQAAMPSLLRGIVDRAAKLPVVKPSGTSSQDRDRNSEPVSELAFYLGRSHPAYDVWGDKLAPAYDPPYAWYVRVADVPGFVRHIAPVLEQRLAGSPLTGYDGELKITFYRSGLRLQFEQGKLTAAEPWREPAYGDEAQMGCPALVFLQLLFGHRSLAELQNSYPDVWTNSEAILLVTTLFPKQPSWVWSVSYT